MKEPEIVIEHREQLVYLLSEAAEIEHGLMCCYLYAAMSLKRDERDGLRKDEVALVDGWRNAISTIAIEEMLHLALVNNLLAAVGAGPHFTRPNFPVAPGFHPAGIVVSLAPFDDATLDHFIFLERPEGVELPDGAGFSSPLPYERPAAHDRLMANAQDYLTVGHFYRALEGALESLSDRLGETRLFCGNPAAQVTTAHFPIPGLEAVVDLASAKRALERIIMQGEGSSKEHEESHYRRFLAIRKEVTEARRARPDFEPARPVARNPLMRKPADPTGHIYVDDPKAARVLDFANAMYFHTLRLLNRCYTAAGDTEPQRIALARASMDLMRLLTPVGEQLTKMPASPSSPGVGAGVSFAMSRCLEPIVDGRATWIILTERFEALEGTALTLAADVDPMFGEVAKSLARIAARLHAVATDTRIPASRVEAAPAAAAPATAAAIAPPSPAIEEVPGKRVLLRFEAKRCIHSRHCVLGAPEVFLANVKGAWIYPDAVPVSEIVATAHLCPSGAITYERLDGEPGELTPRVNSVRVRENGPLAFNADLRIASQPSCTRATLCRCGASKNKPYCDSSHAAIGFRATGEPDVTPSEPLAARGGALVVEAAENGPLIVTGNVEVCANTGHTIHRVTGARMCRCGGSSKKPFCDGTHAKNGFRAPAVE